MTSGVRPEALRSYGGFLAALAVLGGGLTAAAALPARGLFGPGAPAAMLAACALALVASAVAGIPLAGLPRASAARATGRLLASLATRFLLVAGGALAVLFASSLDRRPFLLWLALSYLALLAVDVVYALRRAPRS